MIYFRRPYATIREDGVFREAIVLYGKKPWVVEACKHSGENSLTHQVFIEFRHRLGIDLWLAKMRFEWTTKRPNKCPHKEPNNA